MNRKFLSILLIVAFAILLVYVSSSNFDADVAKKLMEMGRGNEALKQMFKNKLDGK